MIFKAASESRWLIVKFQRRPWGWHGHMGTWNSNVAYRLEWFAQFGKTRITLLHLTSEVQIFHSNLGGFRHESFNLVLNRTGLMITFLIGSCDRLIRGVITDKEEHTFFKQVFRKLWRMQLSFQTDLLNEKWLEGAITHWRRRFCALPSLCVWILAFVDLEKKFAYLY